MAFETLGRTKDRVIPTMLVFMAGPLKLGVAVIADVERGVGRHS